MKHRTTAQNEQNELLESIARERLRYETIINEQTEVLRQDPKRLEAAMAELNKSSLVPKPGQGWLPTPEQVDDYLAWCDRLCQTVPVTFEDRVKIVHGANAGLMCVIMCKLGKQPERIQMAILRRYAELSGRREAPASEPPLSEPSGKPRCLTATELQQFQDPDNLHGKQFIFSPDTDDSAMFEVIGYHKKRDRTVQYDVLFEDCGDPILVDTDEMSRMLGNSLYLPA